MDSVRFGFVIHILKVVSILNQGQGIIPQKETGIARQTGFGAKLERDNYNEYTVRMSVPLSGPRYIFLGQDQLCGPHVATASDTELPLFPVYLGHIAATAPSCVLRICEYVFLIHRSSSSTTCRPHSSPIAPVKPSSRKRWPLEPRSLDLCPAQLLIWTSYLRILCFSFPICKKCGYANLIK